MEISEFTYIKVDTYGESLRDKIESIYLMNDGAKTLKHVKLVAEAIVQIAQQYHLDTQKCLLAALLHDISSIMKPDDMLLYAAALGMSLDEAEKRHPFLLHQRLSKIFAQNILSVEDPDILSAIECHTTLKSKPSPYDMALFIADKLSWDQDGRPVFYDQVTSALSSSLEGACLEYMDYMIGNGLILYPHRWFLEAKAFLDGSLAQDG